MKCYKFILLILMQLVISCSNKHNDKPESLDNDGAIHLNQQEESTVTLSDKIILEGDTSAYRSLFIAFLDYRYHEEFLFYAMVMANKYNYPQAYFDVYDFLTNIYLKDVENIDHTTANISTFYLLEAYKKGHHQATDIVKEYSIKYNERTNREQLIRIFK